MQDTVQKLSRKGPLTPSATEGSHPGVKWIYQISAKHTCPEDTETLSGLINTWTSTDIKPGLPVRLRPTAEHLPRKSQLTSGQATSTDATALSLQLSYPGLPSTPQAPQAGITTLTWNLCTSSRDWLSFWSASRMTSVNLWMMTSRGPCSSIGRLRFSCKVRTTQEKSFSI